MSYQNAKLMNLEDGQKLLEAIDQHKAEIGTVAKDWEDHKTEAFTVGEYVVKDNVTYRFKAAHAANTAWNASEVESTNLGSEITGLKSAIGTVPTGKTVQGQVEALQTGKADMIVVTDSTTAAVMTFSDGAADLPMKLEVAIDPVQDLHGYDYPWPGGGGKNLFTYQGETNGYYLTSTGTEQSSANWSYSDYIPVTAGTQYTISGNETYGSAAKHIYYDSSKNILDYINSGERSFITPENAAYMRFSYLTSEKTSIQLELGDSATSYVPYSNICPISGWTGCSVVRKGKNLWSAGDVSITNGTGYIRVNTTHIPGGVLTLSANVVSSDTDATTCSIKTYTYIDGSYRETTDYNRNKISRGNRVSITFGQVSGLGIDRITFYASASTAGSAGDTASFTDIQIELGEVATDYEPYVSDEYNITFPSEAGTVYGGTLTVNKDGTGTLKVTHKIVDLGEYDYAYNTTYAYFYVHTDSDMNTSYGSGSVPNWKCEGYDIYSVKAASGWGSAPNGTVGLRTDGILIIKNLLYSDTTLFKASLSGIHLVYDIATPTTYSLTAPQIATLLGVNNVWADTGNINSVEYAADTKLYIDGKIADAIANILNA